MSAPSEKKIRDRQAATRRLTSAALLFALSLILGFLEHLIPPLPFLPPGVKLGLSHIPIMFLLFSEDVLGFSGLLPALLLSVLKSFFIFLTRGTVAGLLSLLGGLLSVLVMAGAARLLKKASFVLLSALGAVFHNLGQLLGVYFLIAPAFLYYAPVLALSGLIMGTLTGLLYGYVRPALLRSLRLQKPVSLFLVFLLLSSLLSACGAPSSPRGQSASWYDCFHTFSEVTLYDFPPEKAEPLLQDLHEELLALHRVASAHESGDPEISVYDLNASAGKGPVAISRPLYDLLSYGVQAGTDTKGLVNIAIGRLSFLWKEAQTAKRPPSEPKIREALAHISLSSLSLYEKDGLCFAELTDPLMALDLGALTKGYAADLAREFLLQNGAENFLINLGGTLTCHGAPPGKEAFTIGLQDPRGPSGSYTQTLSLRPGESIATSGDYEQYFEYEERRYHHLIDPATGYPGSYHHSVTVICQNEESAAKADMLSTALFLLPTDEGEKLADSFFARVIYQD